MADTTDSPSMPELVDYAYIARETGLSQQTVRVYATGTRQRKDNFPRSIAPAGARSPLFLRTDADRFIDEHLESMAARKIIRTQNAAAKTAAATKSAATNTDVAAATSKTASTKSAAAPRKGAASRARKSKTAAPQTDAA